MKHFIIALLFFTSPINAGATIGSNSAASRQAIASFNGSNNEMRGFAAFENGFTFGNFSTTCLFNSFYPVSGPITMNGGTLTLSLPLVLGKTATLITGGIFTGNGLSIDLPNVPGTFSLGGATTFDTVKLVLHADLALNGVTTFAGYCVIEGNKNDIDLTSSSISVSAGATLVIRNATLKHVGNTSIIGADNTGVLILDNVLWEQAYSTHTFAGDATSIQSSLVGGVWIFNP